MTRAMNPEDLELDGEWRARFGQPLPLLGCAEFVRSLLQDYDGQSRYDAHPSALGRETQLAS
jgi:hypothetical protein